MLLFLDCVRCVYLCCLLVVCVFFFFKQKTAYEMRISDWSSDVCSSDLLFSTFERGIELLDAVAQLAALESRLDTLFRDVAMRYKLFLAAGTTPVRSQRGMRNSGHLYTPSGGIYTQEKLHVTPAEREYWGIVPGEGIRVFETPIGRIAVVIRSEEH